MPSDTEFRTWFEESRLLHLEDGHAIVATPNIFVREKLEGSYAQQISERKQFGPIRRSSGCY